MIDPSHDVDSEQKPLKDIILDRSLMYPKNLHLKVVVHHRTFNTHFFREGEEVTLCGKYNFGWKEHKHGESETVTCKFCMAKLRDVRLVDVDPALIEELNPLFVTTACPGAKTTYHYTKDSLRGLCGSDISDIPIALRTLPADGLARRDALKVLGLPTTTHSATCTRCLASPACPPELQSKEAIRRLANRGKYDRSTARKRGRAMIQYDDD